MTKHRLGLVIVFGLLVAACAPATTGPSGLTGNSFLPSATETPRPAAQALEFGDFDQLLGRDDIAPIYEPKFVSASEPEISSVHVYLRQVGDQTLTFVQQDGQVRDEGSGSTWSMETGLAIEGPLQGQVLKAIPYIPAFRGSWLDFYPQSGVFDGG